MEGEAPSAILKGLRNARVDGVQLVGELFHVEHEFAKDKWAFEVRLELELKTEGQVKPFPPYSHWFVVVDSAYPFGEVEVLPSKVDGIIETYPHQTINLDEFPNLPWRKGKLCLNQPIQSLGLIAGNNDPIGNSEERIRWHLKRSLNWIRAAATNTLIRAGDPFETPFYYPTNSGFRFVHDESERSLHIWEGIKPFDWGFLIWESLPGIEKTAFAVAYFARNGVLLRATPKYDDKKHIIGNQEFLQGFWWLWPAPVVLPPWKAPSNWEELRTIGRAMNINVDEYLRGMAKGLRGKKGVVLLIGYPIPRRIGEQPCEIYWKAISLPEIKVGGMPPHGFRPNEQGWWQRDRTTIFNGRMSLDYMQTENWHPDRIQARGRLSSNLREAKITLIGCGALGSVIAELLARGGASNLMLIDHEDLAAGNLVRHTLSGQDIGKNKAAALANRLISVAPFSTIKVHARRFPTKKNEVISLLEDRDIVIDCTADDEVVSALSLGWWSLEKLFISASVGYEARRTFLFTHQGQAFPQKVFQAMMEPLLQEERALWSGSGETLEGAGCWSPLFPARMDDLLLAASSTIKVLEEKAEKCEPGSRLVTFDQITGEGFLGLKRSDVTGSVERGE
jgi:hypothetical protein